MTPLTNQSLIFLPKNGINMTFYLSARNVIWSGTGHISPDDGFTALLLELWRQTNSTNLQYSLSESATQK